MAKVYNSIIELIGKTPLLSVKRLVQKENLSSNILVKLEYFNPAGSVKDRVAKSMVEKAEKQGSIKEDTTIIEPTSGNTGIGLASVAAAKGYRAIFTMPETMSVERRKLLKAYGAEIVLTEGKLGMKGAIQKANELQKEIPNAIVLGQFVNLANPDAHFDTTGPEIWEDTDGKIDILVAGIGTGGTITGVSQYLKGKNKDLKVVAVEPAGSSILSGGNPGPHGLQGIGAGFVPEILNTSAYDEVVTVENQEAYEGSRLLARTEGVLTGITSGAALHVAIKVAKRPENKGKNIVVILPDTGERYLSTPLFEEV